MAQHQFRLRAAFAYSGDDNKIDHISARILTDDGWVALDLNLATPGFLVFVYSFLVCQHTYFHANSTESDLQLERAELELLLVAGDDWKIESIDVRIDAALRGGEVTAEKRGYIESRMRQCPVSINLKEPENYRIELNFG